MTYTPSPKDGKSACSNPSNNQEPRLNSSLLNFNEIYSIKKLNLKVPILDHDDWGDSGERNSSDSVFLLPTGQPFVGFFCVLGTIATVVVFIDKEVNFLEGRNANHSAEGGYCFAAE